MLALFAVGGLESRLGLVVLCRYRLGGSAVFHPRLDAFTCFAGCCRYSQPNCRDTTLAIQLLTRHALLLLVGFRPPSDPQLLLSTRSVLGF
jgi:hypothetical protein